MPELSTSTPLTTRERIRRQTTTAAETARSLRNEAVIFLGGAALSGVVSAISLARETPAVAILTAGAGAGVALAGVHSGLEANAQGQRAAALEGALAQHELAAAPYTPDQPSHFAEPAPAQIEQQTTQ